MRETEAWPLMQEALALLRSVLLHFPRSRLAALVAYAFLICQPMISESFSFAWPSKLELVLIRLTCGRARFMSLAACKNQ